MIRLEEKVILIAGGAGDVGEEITKEFLHAGADVIVPSRSKEKLEHLKDHVANIDSGRISTLHVDIGSESGLTSLADSIQRKFGKLDGVVASLGSWHAKGNLEEFSMEDWDKAIKGGLYSHFAIAKMAIPIIRSTPGSSYTFVNGGAALQPIPNSGPVSILAAAQLMMKDVVASENKHFQVRVNTLLLNALIKTRARSESDFPMLDAADVGKYLVFLASEKASRIDGKTITFSQVDELPEDVR